jgi:hypothetical protein
VTREVDMHPLNWVNQSDRPMWIGALLILTAVVFVVLRRPERAMRRTGGVGIVPFELAEDGREARRILAMWGPSGRKAARTSLLVDYVFLVLYSALLALACLYLGGHADDRHVGWLATAGVLVAWAALAAGLLDAVENTALLRVLHAGQPANATVSVAHWAARVKFVLVSLCVLYLLIGIGLLALAPANPA